MSMKYFPLSVPRKSQQHVIEEIDHAFKKGYQNVLVEAPVGSGKSAIAVNFTNQVTGEFPLQSSYIITPRKALQDQYREDFPEMVYLMKGRASYPCTYTTQPEAARLIQIRIKQGQSLPYSSANCSIGPCKGNSKVYQKCTEFRPCPYKVAIDVAQKHSAVVHNFHSFIYQSTFAGHFLPRKLLVIDECHEIEDITRDFARFSILLKKEALEVCREPGAGNRSPDKWFQELSQFAELYSDLLVNEVPGTDPKEYTSDREEYLVKLQNMAEKVERMWNESSKEYIHYVVEEGPDIKDTQIRLHFVPIRVRNITQNLLLDYGSQRLLMSGTIYSKKIFSSTVGLKEEETYFIKIGSSFHKANRKILLRRNLALDLSHKAWEDNFQEMIENLQKILDTFGDVKGLIHTPSYWASHQIYNALSRKVGGRLIEHDKDNFHESLAKHYSIPNSSVFVSPICQQGVDFKGDRARFQVILRVPYPNVSDPFTMYMMRNNYQWYNYQALVVFGQQIGRIVRSEEDWGTTILMDSRFEGFINKNRTLLPKWVMESVEIR